MNKKKDLLVIANWKLYPQSLKEARTLLTSYSIPRGLSLVVCPPAVYIQPLSKTYRGRAKFGAQNVFYEKEGAFTGEISPPMVEDAGADYVLVGHAERRALGESDEQVARKAEAALRAGLMAVICVGEGERDEHGFYLNRLKEQLEKAFSGITPALLSRVILAYEPLWAVGASAKHPITPRELQETTLYLRKVLHGFYKNKGVLVPVLYGGSVTDENASLFVEAGGVEGLLVGRESLKPRSFNELLEKLVHA